MGPGFLIVAALAAQSPDTSIYSSAATRELIARAAERHRAQDTSVRDYRAKFHYRLTASLGRRKWGSAPPWAAEEQEGRVAWQLPGELRIEIGGQRSRTRDSRGTLFSAFDQPWFVPRSLSDSVRLFGSDFPERASLHPLAPSGPDWYRYAGGDTITLTTATGRQLRITRVEVVPRRPGPALLAGQLWIDLASAEVVRFAFRYIGTDLWILPETETRKDSAEARKANRMINRVLSLDADLEYALQDGRHWMPYRQVLSGRVQVPLVGDVFIPFEAVTTFSDYAINTGEAVAFRLPPPEPLRRRTPEEREARRDSLRAERRGRVREDTTTAREWAGRLPDGGRFEIRRAPRDSLRTYAGWESALELQVSDAEAKRAEELRREVADLVESLPRDVSGTSVTGFGFERLADAFRFNRVQGGSVGLGYQLDLRFISYSSLYATGRFGLADKRPTGRLAFVRDAPGGRLSVAAFRDLSEGDPFSRGLSAGNAIRALISARDEADYHLATGGAVSFETAAGDAVDLTLTARMERHRSVEKEATAWLHDLYDDGVFPPNPPVEDGWFAGAVARLDGFSGSARWRVAVEGLAAVGGGGTTARAFGEWRQPVGGRRGVTVRAKGGIATTPTLPQMAFRAGGQGSVRGHDYGIQRGDALWAVQADWSPLGRTFRPVLFVDAGQAGRLDELGRARVLTGGGAGLSILNGLVRLELSHPINPRPAGSGLRFDLVLGAVR